MINEHVSEPLEQRCTIHKPAVDCNWKHFNLSIFVFATFFRVLHNVNRTLLNLITHVTYRASLS